MENNRKILNNIIDFLKEHITLSWVRKVSVVAIYFLTMFVFVDLIRNIFSDSLTTYDSRVIYSILLNVILDFILMAISGILLFKELKIDFYETKKFNAGKIWAFVGIGVGCVYGGNLLGSWLSTCFTDAVDSINQMTINQMAKSQYGWLLIFAVVIFGPILEELVFRKALTSSLRDLKIPNYITWVVVAILFGFIHVSSGDYAMIFPYVFMGLALGIIEYYSNSIYPPIIVHILINGIATLLMFLI